jgi:cellulose synthase/poly-beta-1,6-N-acetylglucosamine synthase-like glycosyltransferase
MEQGTKVNQEEWVRLEKKFKLSEFTEELPMCIIVPGYNNNDQFRIESNMNSIFTQNYTNYKVVIINDASNDGSGEVYRKYLDFYNIDRSRYVYVEN